MKSLLVITLIFGALIAGVGIGISYADGRLRTDIAALKMKIYLDSHTAKQKELISQAWEMNSKHCQRELIELESK